MLLIFFLAESSRLSLETFIFHCIHPYQKESQNDLVCIKLTRLQLIYQGFDLQVTHSKQLLWWLRVHVSGQTDMGLHCLPLLLHWMHFSMVKNLRLLQHFFWGGGGFMISAMSWENLFMPYANNKGADQPAHLRSPTSTFVVPCLDSIIPMLAKSKISRL